MTMPWGRALAILGSVLLGVALRTERAESHKLITSKYTYNEDVFPILRDHCGRCHVEGGVAPMSLMTYKEAYPWGESLRAELIAGHMPPWGAEESLGTLRNAPQITGAEIDKILVWASGGNPEGNPLKTPPEVALSHDWPLGTPDLELHCPETTLAADASEATREFTLPGNTTEARWVRAVDLLPGVPSIVRNATISVRSNARKDTGAAPTTPEDVLAVWVPGESPVPADGGAAFQLPAGAELVVRVHYKKTYKYDGKPMTERSAVGLYFARTSASEIRRLTVASPPITATRYQRVVFSSTITEDIQVLGLNPDPALSNASLQIDVVNPNGVRTRAIQLTVRPDWTRRYWFQEPLALSRGSRIEVAATVNGADTLLPPAASPTPTETVNSMPIVVSFQVVRTEADRAGH